MPKNQISTLKKAVSFGIGIPAAIIVASEIEDLSLSWIQFAAVAILIAILFWNHAFDNLLKGEL